MLIRGKFSKRAEGYKSLNAIARVMQGRSWSILMQGEMLEQW